MIAIFLYCLIMGFIGLIIGGDRQIGSITGFILGFLLGFIGLIIVVASKRID